MANVNNEQIWDLITSVINETLLDQGVTPPPMTPATQVYQDLGISSLDFVNMLLTLEEKLGQAFEFEKIAVRDGEYRTELTLGELQEFLVGSGTTGLSDTMPAV